MVWHERGANFDSDHILDKKYKKLEETIQRVVTKTIGYARKQANKEWFDEECAKGNKKKNATRERAIQIKTRHEWEADEFGQRPFGV
jgi:hypothetical protein